MDRIYTKNLQDGTCYPLHRDCGWPSIRNTPSRANLPTFILSVGLEGAGHHLWTEIFEPPVVDCIWTNARHYHRDIADGVPRTSPEKLQEGISEQLQLRIASGKPACQLIYDSEDSFPTGAIRKNGRIFMHPDIVNLQKLDGVMLNVKYLIIMRNITDTALSALRRNFFSSIDPELRTVEHTLTYIESALRGVPCQHIFLAHYEHVLADPLAFLSPLSTFFELGKKSTEILKKRLIKMAEESGAISSSSSSSPVPLSKRLPLRKAHKLTQYSECLKMPDEKKCYERVSSILDRFFLDRSFMWPTFAGNGFDIAREGQ